MSGVVQDVGAALELAAGKRFMKYLFPLLALIATTLGGCKPPVVHHDPPETVGERTNQQVVVTQRIVRERSYTSEDVPLTPEGPRHKVKYTVKYFMEESGKPRREFSVMQSADFSNYEKYWPVEKTSSWVGTGIDPVGNGDILHFVLFDESRIIRTRIFTVVPKWRSKKDEYELQDGNRTLILRKVDGIEKYDVLADTTANVEK